MGDQFPKTTSPIGDAAKVGDERAEPIRWGDVFASLVKVHGVNPAALMEIRLDWWFSYFQPLNPVTSRIAKAVQKGDYLTGFRAIWRKRFSEFVGLHPDVIHIAVEAEVKRYKFGWNAHWNAMPGEAGGGIGTMEIGAVDGNQQ